MPLHNRTMNRMFTAYPPHHHRAIGKGGYTQAAWILHRKPGKLPRPISRLLDGALLTNSSLFPVVIGSAIARTTSRRGQQFGVNHVGPTDLAYRVSVTHANAILLWYNRKRPETLRLMKNGKRRLRTRNYETIGWKI